MALERPPSTWRYGAAWPLNAAGSIVLYVATSAPAERVQSVTSAAGGAPAPGARPGLFVLAVAPARFGALVRGLNQTAPARYFPTEADVDDVAAGRMDYSVLPWSGMGDI